MRIEGFSTASFPCPHSLVQEMLQNYNEVTCDITKWGWRDFIAAQSGKA